MRPPDTPLEIAGITIKPGERRTIDVPVASLSSHTPLAMPVHVLRGRREGPRIFVSAALHGDEINGVEIIRRLLKTKALRQLRGTLIAVPIVNIFGFITGSRYLPDRRDLNRVFPGSPRGSLGSRLADLFMSEIVSKCSHGIDLHTGAVHRVNLPQIRANLDDEETLELARAFGAPVIINAAEREGTVREAACALGAKILLYEAGEALRFDDIAIRVGVRGILNVLRAMEMLPPTRRRRLLPEPATARSVGWVRALQSGIFRCSARLGAHVREGQTLGAIADPFGENEEIVVSHNDGIIIGRTNLPLVHEGDGLIHIASPEGHKVAFESLQAFEEQYAVQSAGLDT